MCASVNYMYTQTKNVTHLVHYIYLAFLRGVPVYVGQTGNFENRKRGHRNNNEYPERKHWEFKKIDRVEGVADSKDMQDVVDQDWDGNIVRDKMSKNEMLFWDEVERKERYYIHKYDTFENGENRTPGGISHCDRITWGKKYRAKQRWADMSEGEREKIQAMQKKRMKAQKIERQEMLEKRSYSNTKKRCDWSWVTPCIFWVCLIAVFIYSLGT